MRTGISVEFPRLAVAVTVLPSRGTVRGNFMVRCRSRWGVVLKFRFPALTVFRRLLAVLMVLPPRGRLVVVRRDIPLKVTRTG